MEIASGKEQERPRNDICGQVAPAGNKEKKLI
jgi:hypothetical protein